ncbi:outer membrane protein [Mesorhizobium sp. B1-1-8]|uniref:outer membrane protein n=1 Tax=Mesorhizobium sp. B1-1-8 TaxID=2589976 RepID=UPI001D0317B9|nr:outer membrane beta-barrel protein [Mesorhizobium sp. B1-1-8]UCI10775.1 outer membrane beta-barrel protein [Mesorhizobium sp. B1-1-8]
MIIARDLPQRNKGLYLFVIQTNAAGRVDLRRLPTCWQIGQSALAPADNPKPPPVFDSFLPYATGGFAVGHVKGSADLGACGFTPTCSYSDTRWGWTAGAGVEWAMNQKLSLKTEYLHVDLGKPNFDSLGNPSTDAIKFDTVRVGLNYHF